MRTKIQATALRERFQCNKINTSIISLDWYQLLYYCLLSTQGRQCHCHHYHCLMIHHSPVELLHCLCNECSCYALPPTDPELHFLRVHSSPYHPKIYNHLQNPNRPLSCLLYQSCIHQKMESSHLYPSLLVLPLQDHVF